MAFYKFIVKRNGMCRDMVSDSNISEIPFTLTEMSRREQWVIWLQRQRETQAHLALIVGLSPCVLSRYLGSDTIPVSLHERLVRYGVPASLLPEPLNKKRGRQPLVSKIAVTERKTP